MIKEKLKISNKKLHIKIKRENKFNQLIIFNKFSQLIKIYWLIIKENNKLAMINWINKEIKS